MSRFVLLQRQLLIGLRRLRLSFTVDQRSAGIQGLLHRQLGGHRNAVVVDRARIAFDCEHMLGVGAQHHLIDVLEIAADRRCGQRAGRTRTSLVGRPPMPRVDLVNAGQRLLEHRVVRMRGIVEQRRAAARRIVGRQARYRERHGG